MAPLPLRTWLDGMPPAAAEPPAALVVVIDVLRATTTAAAALAEGASYIAPVVDAATAFRLKEAWESEGEAPVLGGERGGQKIPGFDLGNSPREYHAGHVAGRPVILCTTNGTQAIERNHGAARLYAASFVNAGATAADIVRTAEAVTLCCAGKEGTPGLEDICCAGLVASLIMAKQPYAADDATLAALAVWRKYHKDVPKLMRDCNHGRYLASLGYEEDLNFAARVDALPVTVKRDPRGYLTRFEAVG